MWTWTTFVLYFVCGFWMVVAANEEGIHRGEIGCTWLEKLIGILLWPLVCVLVCTECIEELWRISKERIRQAIIRRAMR